MPKLIEESVREAQAGSKLALQDVIAGIQDQIYGLALRMLWHPEDARDAAQEILVRIVTHLGSFRGESRFTTWAYRVASNYLISSRQSRLEQQAYRFERFGEELDQGLSAVATHSDSDPERDLLLQEVRVGCTMGMLLVSIDRIGSRTFSVRSLKSRAARRPRFCRRQPPVIDSDSRVPAARSSTSWWQNAAS